MTDYVTCIMNEEMFISFLSGVFPRTPDVAMGIGDDAAVLDLHLPGRQYLLAAADQAVSGVHFVPGTDPVLVAEKLLKRNLSDIAAMGGLPTHALVTLSVSPMEESWLRAFHEGLARCAARYHVAVIGGDTSSAPAPGITASLTILGTVTAKKLCLRSNAEEGDYLYCTGEYGNSFASGWHLHFEPRLKEACFLAGRFTSAMMDVSDGLWKDASRLAAASELALAMDLSELPLRAGADPLSAPSDGEDYELLFAVHPSQASELEDIWPFAGVKLTRIGEFRAGEPGEILNGGESAVRGYDHLNGEK